jgi:hypothetical protein
MGSSVADKTSVENTEAERKIGADQKGADRSRAKLTIGVGSRP